MVCVLFASKLDDKVSKINVRGCSAFLSEAKFRKLLLNCAIDDSTCMCIPAFANLQSKQVHGGKFHSRRQRSETLEKNLHLKRNKTVPAPSSSLGRLKKTLLAG